MPGHASINGHFMLDLEDLRLVRAIGASRSLASAARLLDLTPPAVTLRLRRMERGSRSGSRCGSRKASR
jgi:hypothetical protein